MRKILLWVLMVVFLAGSVYATCTVESETQITNNTADQLYPKIYGDKIVWMDERNGNLDIYIYNLSISTETQITINTADQQNPAIYGNKIVWADKRNGNYDIYMYDLSTGTERQITNTTTPQVNPAIYEDKIVWMDNNVSDWKQVYMYDLATSTKTKITVNPTDRYFPKIYGDKIVWMDSRNGNSDIYMYNLNTGTETQITTDTLDQYFPEIYGDKIVWTDFRNGAADIYMHDLSAGTETQITTDTGPQEYPAIYGNKIVWEGSNGYYNISNGQFVSILGLNIGYFPIIYDDMIIWNDNKNGNWDIYITKLSAGCSSGPIQNCTIPTDGMSITENTTFCPGTYDLPNGMTIDADNIVLDCDGAVLNGTGLNTGIDIQPSSGVTVKNCNIWGYYFHIGLSGMNNIVQNNVINNNGGNWGIVLGSSTNSLVYNNTIYMNNFGNGIVLGSSSSNNNITNNKLYDGFPDGVGVGLEAVNNNTIYNNLISNFVVGLQLGESSSNNVIEENILVNNSWGILFFESYDNIIRKNNIMFNNIGITFKNYASTGNIIEFNNIYNNIGYELYNNIAQDIMAENNYWGTTSMSEINNRIFDHNDDIFKGSVYYCPILNDSYPYGSVLSNEGCVIRIDILVFINNPIKYSTITSSSTLLDVTTSKNTTCVYSVNICNGSDITKGGNCTELRNDIMGITGSQSHLQLVENFTDTKQDVWYRLGVNCSDDSDHSSSRYVPFYVNMVSNTTPATCPADMADLIVLDVNTPKNAMAGDSLAFGATIKNQGSITTFFSQQYKVVGPTNFGVFSVADLSNPIVPSETKTIALAGDGAVGPLEEGTYTITMTVQSESPDCDLNNNNMTETFYVSAYVPKEGFMINIINPVSGSTIDTHSTLLDAMTNKFATCSYKLDSGDYVQFPSEEYYLLPNLNYGDEINDLLGDIPLNESDLPLLLAQGLFRDLIGQTDNDVVYSQNLYFVSTALDNTNIKGTGQLTFEADDDGDKTVNNYLLFDDDSSDYMYVYSLMFDSPVQYTTTAEHPPNEDLEGTTITIQGNEFTITDVKYNASYVIDKLTLLTGDLIWLASNASITRVVNGIEHEIGVVNATETMCGVNVDGDVAWIDKGNSQTINGVTVAVMDAVKVINTSESICKLAVGASEYILENGKEIKVNGVTLSGSEADLIGTAGNWEGFEVRYTPGDEEYIPTGSSLADPVFGNFEVYFNGITKTTEEMTLKTSNDGAEFVFINNHGVNVTLPFYYNGTDINPGDDFSAGTCDGRLFMNGESCDVSSGFASISDIEGVLFLMTTSDGEAHVMQISDISLATDQNITDIKDFTYGTTYQNIPVIFDSPTDLTLGTLGTITLTMTTDGSITFNNIFLGGLPKTSYGALINLSKDSVFVIEGNEGNNGLIWNLSLYYYPTLNEVRIASPTLLEGAQGPQWNKTDLRASKRDKYTKYSVTEWGTLVRYDSYDKNDLTLWYPDEQVYGSAYILHGGLSHKENLTNLDDGQHTVEVECTDLNGNSNTTSVTFNVDTTPLIINITNPLDDSTINADSVWLNVTTSEDAVCNYSLCYSVSFAAPPCEGGDPYQPCSGGGGAGACSKPKNMSITNGISHLQLITGLKNTINNETNSASYYLNVKCEDNSGNSNTTSIIFNVDVTDMAPPIITLNYPANSTELPAGTSSVYLNISTNEQAECEYNMLDFSFGEGNKFTSNDSIEHTTLAYDLVDGNSYIYYYRCNDTAGNINDGVITQIFSIATTPNGGGGNNNGGGGGSHHNGGGYAPLIGGTVTPPIIPAVTGTQGGAEIQAEGANPNSEGITEAATEDNQPKEQGGLGGITGAVIGALKKPVARTTAILVAVMAMTLFGVYLYGQKRKIKIL